MSYREFLDESGATWRVWDTYPESSTRLGLAELQGGWLTFEHDNARRRLVPAPDGWAEATDETLRSWLRGATPATVRKKDIDLPLPPDGALEKSSASSARPPMPRVPDDTRAMIERSRETLNLLDRAIDRRSETVGDPRGATDRIPDRRR